MENRKPDFALTIWANGNEKIFGNSYGFVFKDQTRTLYPMGSSLKMVIKRLEKMGRNDVAEELRKS